MHPLALVPLLHFLRFNFLCCAYGRGLPFTNIGERQTELGVSFSQALYLFLYDPFLGEKGGQKKRERSISLS